MSCMDLPPASSGEKLAFNGGIDRSTSLYVYTVSYNEANVKIADNDLFYLVLKTGVAGKAEDFKLSLNYTEALDRIGHSTKLYIGSRPDPPQADTRRRGM